MVSSTEDSIEFDLVCWFTGQAAIDAAAEDGQESPPPNDYYVRNENEQTRSLAIAVTTPTVIFLTEDPGYGTFGHWRRVVAERGNLYAVAVEVVDGTVKSMVEMWVP